MYGGTREPFLADMLPLEGVNALDESNRESRRRTQTGEGREIRGQIYFHIFQHTTIPQYLSKWPVLYFVQALCVFNFTICEANVMVKQPRRQVRHRMIDILVDGGSKYSTTVPRKKIRKVCSAAEKTDSEWSSHDYHATLSGYRLCSTTSTLGSVVEFRAGKVVEDLLLLAIPLL